MARKVMGRSRNWWAWLAPLLLAACGPEPPSGAGAGGQEAAAPQQFQWRMVTTWPKNYPVLGTAPEEFAALVERMSAGRLQIKVYGDRQLVPALEVFDTVARGTVEMGHGAAYYWKGKVPAAQFFTTIPFGLTAQEMNAWLHHGGGLELWRRLYEPYGLVPMAGGNTGVQMSGWFNREIRSLEDLRGLKVRIPGLGGEIFQRLGAVAVSLPGGELFTSLQTGVIDAAEWIGPYNDMNFGFHRVARYYYYPGWQEPGATLEILINRQAYDSLPEDLQAILETAARAVNQNMLDEYTARNPAALRKLMEEHGVELRRLPEDVLRRLRQETGQVIQQLAATNVLATEIHQSMSSFAREMEFYQQFSERAYLDLRWRRWGLGTSFALLPGHRDCPGNRAGDSAAGD